MLNMRRIEYVFRVCFASAIGVAVLLWFFSPYNTVGVEQYLPKRNLLNGAYVVLVGILLKIWEFKAKIPPLSDSLSLRKTTYRILRRTGFYLELIPMARFTWPLISHHFSWGAKLQPRETMFYSTAFFIGAIMRSDTKVVCQKYNAFSG